ncbi:MAG: GIY-YIG nuclease family protein [Bacteroidales bacterium]|nr:GIY-YIG nuclease family protein [Bacteroidales bacterium]
MKGYMYILECSNGCYYTGSTNNLERRFAEHQNGEGANYTKKHLPVKLVYFEEFYRIDEAYYREKQVQGWSRKKKEALINKTPEKLHKLSECMNENHHRSLRLRSGNGEKEEGEPLRSLSEAETPSVAERSRSAEQQ